MEDHEFSAHNFQRRLTVDKALEEFSRLFDPEKGDDRAVAIVGAAFVDTLIEQVLRSFLPDDVEVEKLLNSINHLEHWEQGPNGLRLATKLEFKNSL